MHETPEALPSTELVLRHSGQLVNLEDIPQVVSALGEVRRIKTALQDAERTLRDVLIAEAEHQGAKTFHLEGIGKIQVKGGTEVVYDAEAIERDLRAIECPENVIREIVQEVITYKVNGVRANQAAKANPAYAEVITRHKRTIVKTPSVSVP